MSGEGWEEFEVHSDATWSDISVLEQVDDWKCGCSSGLKMHLLPRIFFDAWQIGVVSLNGIGTAIIVPLLPIVAVFAIDVALFGGDSTSSVCEHFKFGFCLEIDCHDCVLTDSAFVASS